MTLLQRLFLAPIKAYKRYISPSLPPACRFYPSCSTYAMQAIEKHGVFKGIILGAWRLLRCNPYAHGGYDPVPERWLAAFKHSNYDFPDEPD